jgi:hypothetical protein
LLLLSAQGKERTAKHQLPGVKIIDVKDFVSIFEKEKIVAQSQNIFFLGMFAKILSEKGFCDESLLHQKLESILGKKPGWAENERAFKLGLNY